MIDKTQFDAKMADRQCRRLNENYYRDYIHSEISQHDELAERLACHCSAATMQGPAKSPSP